ncbi:MAG: hypothetical protein ACYTGU_18435 [Planctomycetota bacterium]|jgi:hypothetical protein
MNKKLLVVAFAAVLVFGSLATVAQAGNFISDAVVPYCKHIAAYGHISVGECVSYYAQDFNNGGNSGPAKFCQDAWQWFGFKNVGQCVSFFRGN